MSIIYHYTNVDAFLSIMQNKKLWLSSSTQMNDSLDGIWGYNILHQYLEKIVTEENRVKFNAFWSTAKLNTHPPYICCFSKKGDLLSQWRAYADDGHGVSIGFHREEFNIKNTIPSNNASKEFCLGMIDIIYNQEIQKQFIHNIVDNHKENSFDMPVMFARNILYFKNPAFIEENEVRIIYTPLILYSERFNTCTVPDNLGDIKQRVVGKKITSYFELEFNPTQVLEIILGPKCQIDEFEIKKLLGINDFLITKVKRSTATYR